MRARPIVTLISPRLAPSLRAVDPPLKNTMQKFMRWAIGLNIYPVSCPCPCARNSVCICPRPRAFVFPLCISPNVPYKCKIVRAAVPQGSSTVVRASSVCVRPSSSLLPPPFPLLQRYCILMYYFLLSEASLAKSEPRCHSVHSLSSLSGPPAFCMHVLCMHAFPIRQGFDIRACPRVCIWCPSFTPL